MIFFLFEREREGGSEGEREGQRERDTERERGRERLTYYWFDVPNDCSGNSLES